MTKRRVPLVARFWQKVDTNGPVPAHMPELGRCWLWTGKPLANGYGYIARDAPERGRLYAHRVAWEMAAGPPGDGVVCHTCDTPLCVRNDEIGVYVVTGIEYPRRGHLWLGTHAANIADRDAKGRWSGGRPMQSHCVHGHELVPENLYVYSNGDRACRTCKRLQVQQRRARKRLSD